ncbi:MAG: hypothetical protein M3014_03270 [Chloroflexota bacterium]|nr:hypothetical protein [Chloroflexota bacterium]
MVTSKKPICLENALLERSSVYKFQQQLPRFTHAREVSSSVLATPGAAAHIYSSLPQKEVSV